MSEQGWPRSQPSLISKPSFLRHQFEGFLLCVSGSLVGQVYWSFVPHLPTSDITHDLFLWEDDLACSFSEPSNSLANPSIYFLCFFPLSVFLPSFPPFFLSYGWVHASFADYSRQLPNEITEPRDLGTVPERRLPYTWTWVTSLAGEDRGIQRVIATGNQQVRQLPPAKPKKELGTLWSACRGWVTHCGLLEVPDTETGEVKVW